MNLKRIETKAAPEAIGPYSQAIVHDNIVYTSGQIGLEPKSGEFAGDTIGTQTRQIMENLEAVLQAAGSGLSQVIKCSIYLKSMDDFPVVNQLYGEYFKDHLPARETVAVKTLPKNALVEISCIAAVAR
ncbi:MAG: Rid family detoxifying hydrolase [Balneolales bacterium]|nr:Rid family detoxifying hydrolase [Balneolales bacterium]